MFEKLIVKAGREIASYRNIYTCFPSQNIYDDICDLEDFEAIFQIDNETSGIDHSLPSRNRIFQYANVESTLGIFQKPSLWSGRFSDGSHGVWYGALEEISSVKEALHWVAKFVAPDLRNTKDPITVDRKMFRVRLEHPKIIDLIPVTSDYPKLVADSDYSFCHNLGNYASKQGIGYLRTPSVRNRGGICTPAFTPTAIHNEKAVYYLKFVFSSGHSPSWMQSSEI